MVRPTVYVPYVWRACHSAAATARRRRSRRCCYKFTPLCLRCATHTGHSGIPAWIPFVVASLNFSDVERAMLMASFFPGYLCTQIPGRSSTQPSACLEHTGGTARAPHALHRRADHRACAGAWLIQRIGAKAVLFWDMAATAALCLLVPAAARSARLLAVLLTVMGVVSGPLIPAMQVRVPTGRAALQHPTARIALPGLPTAAVPGRSGGGGGGSSGSRERDRQTERAQRRMIMFLPAIPGPQTELAARRTREGAGPPVHVAAVRSRGGACLSLSRRASQPLSRSSEPAESALPLCLCASAPLRLCTSAPLRLCASAPLCLSVSISLCLAVSILSLTLSGVSSLIESGIGQVLSLTVYPMISVKWGWKVRRLSQQALPFYFRRHS